MEAHTIDPESKQFPEISTKSAFQAPNRFYLLVACIYSILPHVVCICTWNPRCIILMPYIMTANSKI